MASQVFINAVSCKSGGGLNDLVQTLPLLWSELDRAGVHAKTFVVPEGHKALAAAGADMTDVEIVAVGRPLSRAFWEFFQLPARARKARARVLFQFSNFLFRPVSGASQIVVLRSRAFFSDAYGNLSRRGLYQRLRYGAGRQLSRLTLLIADAVFCLSNVQRSEIIAVFGELGEAVNVITPGVNVPVRWMGTAGGNRSAAESRCGASGDWPPESLNERTLLLNVANYYEHKNLITLLKATELLTVAYPDILLVLTAGIEDYRGALTAQVAEEKLIAARLRRSGFLVDLGNIEQDRVWPLLARAAVFAFPSSTESFGHPLVEAMSIGVPVVASDTPIHREVCGDAAVFHDTFDERALAAAVSLVLSGEALKRELVGRGLQRALKYSWQAHAEQLAQAIVLLARFELKRPAVGTEGSNWRQIP